MSIESGAKVDKALVEIVDHLRILMGITHEFTEPTEQQPLLHSVLNEKYLASLQNLQNMETFDFDVPLEVLEFIDNGSDPQLYNLNLNDTLANLNKVANAKSEAFQFFKSELEKDMANQLPDQWEKYKQLQNKMKK